MNTMINKVIIYSTPACVYCRMAKEFLRSMASVLRNSMFLLMKRPAKKCPTSRIRWAFR